jgi:hypothetical protein
MCKWFDESISTDLKSTCFSSSSNCFVANGAITLVIIALHFVCEHLNLSLEHFLTMVMELKLQLCTAVWYAKVASCTASDISFSLSLLGFKKLLMI